MLLSGALREFWIFIAADRVEHFSQLGCRGRWHAKRVLWLAEDGAGLPVLLPRHCRLPVRQLLLQFLSLFEIEGLKLQKRLGVQLILLIGCLLLLSLTAIVPNPGLDVLGLLLLALGHMLLLLLLQWCQTVAKNFLHKLIGGGLLDGFWRRNLRSDVLFVVVDVFAKLPCQGSRRLVVHESLQCRWIGGRTLILLRRWNILSHHLN